MLEEIIKKHIKRHGFINLATYMELCLSHPKYGYYKTQTAIGTLEQDFITSPELSSLFGEILGVFLVKQINQYVNPKEKLHLIELGPGKGTLMHDVLKTITQFHPDLDLEVTFLEINPIFIKAQSEMMQEYFSNIPFHHIEQISNFPVGQSFCFSNEFFDALPIRGFQKYKDKFLEQIVSVNDQEELCLTLSPKQSGLSISFDLTYPDAEDGSIIETSSVVENLMLNLIHHYQENPGIIFICDYGYTISPKKTTLRAIQHHQFVDLFKKPGKIDLSAFVDFEKLKNLIPYPYHFMSQSDFLESNGALERLKKDHSNASNLLLNESDMGNIFKVLYFSTFKETSKCHI